ncbi:hypothetical protein Tco_1142867 [Tanacetum coccineum]
MVETEIIDPKTDKPRKIKGQASSSEELKLGDYDPLFLHSNDSNDDDILRQEQWDKCNSLVLSWILGCVTYDLYLGQIYSTNAKVDWDELEETYSKSDGSFLMGLDEVYASVRSNILIIDPIPDVKSAFATLGNIPL